jgi:hypothetical protein
MYPPTIPKKDQKTIMTVAIEPRFDGDKNPSNANTKPSVSADSLEQRGKEFTQRDRDHRTELCPIADKDRQEERCLRCTEYFTVDELPAKVFLNFFLFLGQTSPTHS